MKKMESSAELDEIVGHMESDKLSISPYLNGYLIAKGSKHEKKLNTLDPAVIHPAPSPHENYVFVEEKDWQMVKYARPKTHHMKA